MATAAAAAAASSLLAPAASTAPAAPNALLFPSSVPTLRAYPRLLLAFRRPAAAAVADPQGAVLEAEEVEADQRGRYDDEDEDGGYEGGRGPAFTPSTRPRTGKAALPLKRDRVRIQPLPPSCAIRVFVFPRLCMVGSRCAGFEEGRRRGPRGSSRYRS